MAPTDWITNYRRYLKRRNDSPHTVKNYMTSLGQFLRWLDESCEEVTPRVISHYIDFLMARGLRPKTINCHLERIRQFYHYLIQEEDHKLVNPVKKGYGQRMSKPLPKHLPIPLPTGAAPSQFPICLPVFGPAPFGPVLSPCGIFSTSKVFIMNIYSL